MVSKSDFVTIPFNPDMTMAGIKYTCRSLTNERDQFRNSQINKLRETIAKNVVKLGLKRYLDQTNTPYEMMRSTPFSDPEHYDIAIGGRRCDINVILITDKRQIRSIRAEPHLMLQIQTLIPFDKLSGGELFANDILIFIFLTALITPNRRTIEKANAAGQPIYMFNMFPRNWAIPVRWDSLGTIQIESNMENSIHLEFGGCNIDRQFQSESFILNPRDKVNLKHNFYTLGYIHTPNLPDDAIRVYSTFLKETYLVSPYTWTNLWIYGMDIIIGGYVTRKEFQNNARRISKSSRKIQSSCASKEILSLPIHKLHSIKYLFEHAKTWSRL